MSDQTNLKILRNKKSDSAQFLKKSGSSNQAIFIALISIFIVLSLGSMASMDTCQAVEIVNESANNTSNNSSEDYAAGSEDVTLTKTQILDAGTRVANFIEKNKRLPSTVTAGNTTLTIAQFAYVSSAFIAGAREVTLFDVASQKYWIYRFSTSFTTAQYTDMAKKTRDYIYNNKIIPTSVSSANGKVDFYNMVYVYSKALRYYKSYGKMPKTISLSTPIPYTARQLDSNYVDKQISSIQSQIKTVKSSMSYYAAKIKKTTNKKTLQTLKSKYNSLNSKLKTLNSLLSYYNKFKSSEWYIPSSYRGYLKETAYAQQTNPNIVVLAQELTTNDSYETANNIFEWVRDNIDYQFYYKTRYGATGTLSGGDGNCVDQAHLVVALARSAGIPARYVRGYCKFMSGNYYAHVWAQVWVKGYGWLTADTTHSINSLGYARNWNASKSTIYGTMAEYSSK